MLVTDAMPTVGSVMKRFKIGKSDIAAEAGILRSAEGTLAGSNLNMADALRNCLNMMNLTLPTASHMASHTPAAFLGLGASYGQIAVGYRADMVHLSDTLQVQATWIAGEVI
jgi:N-acetylglucosamine-6-phosphate deacetylase